jgi:hypothetical protein
MTPPPVSVILTCTVHPQVHVSRARRDDRILDYALSVQKWKSLLRSGDQLIVVENSGFDLRSVLPSDTASLIDYVPAPYPEPEDIKRGKGYLEARMITHALALARLDVVVKATGRLQVSNFRRLRTDWPPGALRWLSARLSFDLQFADTRFYVGDPASMQAANQCAHDVVDESNAVWIEQALARYITTAVGAGDVEFIRFRRAPFVRGSSGSVDRRYGGLRWLARRALEHGFRRATFRSGSQWI